MNSLHAYLLKTIDSSIWLKFVSLFNVLHIYKIQWLTNVFSIFSLLDSFRSHANNSARKLSTYHLKSLTRRWFNELSNFTVRRLKPEQFYLSQKSVYVYAHSRMWLCSELARQYKYFLIGLQRTRSWYTRFENNFIFSLLRRSRSCDHSIYNPVFLSKVNAFITWFENLQNKGRTISDTSQFSIPTIKSIHLQTVNFNLPTFNTLSFLDIRKIQNVFPEIHYISYLNLLSTFTCVQRSKFVWKHKLQQYSKNSKTQCGLTSFNENFRNYSLFFKFQNLLKKYVCRATRPVFAMFLKQVPTFLNSAQKRINSFVIQNRLSHSYRTKFRISRFKSSILRCLHLQRLFKYTVPYVTPRRFRKISFYFNQRQFTKFTLDLVYNFTYVRNIQWIYHYRSRFDKWLIRRSDFCLQCGKVLNSSTSSLRYMQNNMSNIMFQAIIQHKFTSLRFTSLTNNSILSLPFKTLNLLPSINSSVLVHPKYTRRFKRSPYFFLLILQENKVVHIDWIFAAFNYDSKYSFTLFPSANNFKISIFKRLNFQKIWLLNQLDSFSTYTNKQFSSISSLTKYSFISPISVKVQANLTLLPSWSSILYETRTKLNSSSSFTRHLRIRRIRFKPGYMRIWRDSRMNIQEILEMRIRYQYRLTTKLQQLYNQQQSRMFTYSTATVFFLLLGSQLSVDMWSTLELLRSDSIYLNGRICTNSFTHLFLHDFVQVVINLKFYFLVRFLQNRAIWTLARTNKIFYRKFRIKGANIDIRMRKKLPWTFLHLQNSYLDILPYLEVDYFTLSSFVILDQRAAKLWLPIRAYTLELNILNMYNWKYIT